MALDWVVPDTDVWIAVLERHQPDAQLIAALGALVRSRQLLLPAGVRLAVLARTRDRRQFLRCEAALAAFPSILPTHHDHLVAARLVQRARAGGLDLGAPRALLWAVCDRVRGSLWSRDAGWRAFAAQGCPLLDA